MTNQEKIAIQQVIVKIVTSEIRENRGVREPVDLMEWYTDEFDRLHDLIPCDPEDKEGEEMIESVIDVFVLAYEQIKFLNEL